VGKPQEVPDEDHEVVYERVAGGCGRGVRGGVPARPDPARPGWFALRVAAGLRVVGWMGGWRSWAPVFICR
jgi:hypothetical protein